MGETVKKELITLVSSVIGVIVLSYVVQANDDPDFTRTLKMRGALKAKNLCNKTALHILQLGDKADQLYERERT